MSRLIEVLLDPLGPAPLFTICVDANLVKDIEQVRRRRIFGALEFPEMAPRLGQRGQRMMIGHLEYHAVPRVVVQGSKKRDDVGDRSEEHTSELQSLRH